MRTFYVYLRLLLLAIGGILLLCMIVKADPGLADGVISGKICWYHTSVFFFAGCVLFMELTTRKSRYTFSLPDGLLLLLMGLVLFSYDKELNLQPEKLLFLSQLTLLWFMLRATLQTHPELKVFYLLIIVCSGLFEAAWGISHLYGDEKSVHPLFEEIDFSFHAGPLLGYVAVVLPVCLNMVLRFYNCNKSAFWEARTQLFYVSCLATILILFVLPGGISRAAWIAALISCAWVCWMRKIGWEKTKEKIRRHRITFAMYTFAIFVLSTALPQVGEWLNIDSAGNRILMWNVTTKAIWEHPFTGSGLGSYPALYARTQAAYLGSGVATEAEKMAVCYPAFPFNDYLHIGVEIGIVGLLIFLLWIGFSLYYGIKHRQIGACGGILAMGVFAMYSYPLQLPSFWILLIFFTCICTTCSRCHEKYPQKSYPYIGALAALFSCLLFFSHREMPQTYKEWKSLEVLYEEHAYEEAAPRYIHLYPYLSHQYTFLMQGADCLSNTGRYSQAVVWLERAMLLSADPEIYQQMAKNKRKLGKFREAERYLKEIERFYACPTKN